MTRCESGVSCSRPAWTWAVAVLALAAVPGPAAAEVAAEGVGGSDASSPPTRPGAKGAASRAVTPLPDAPPLPPLPPVYRGSDPAMEAAREIRRRVPRMVNYRAAIPLATWRVDESRVFRVRPTAECRRALTAAKVRARPYEPEPDDEDAPDVFPTPAPVIVRAPVEGVSFISTRGPLLISCELAARLPALARVFAAHGIDRVAVPSSWRPQPPSSFHTMGMGLDITRMRAVEPLPGADGASSRWLVVEDDFVETPDRPTCDPALLEPDGPLAGNERGRRLLAVACALFESGVLSSVLTPNYNAGHRDHFHLDIRPDDPRSFIR